MMGRVGQEQWPGTISPNRPPQFLWIYTRPVSGLMSITTTRRLPMYTHSGYVRSNSFTVAGAVLGLC